MRGKAFPGKFLVLGVLGETETTRVGFITSRRVGNAVERNRIRRRLREIVRHHLPRVKRGTWLVLIARRHAVSAPFPAIEREWLLLAKRASILAAE
jgi:ribonuclease P protein component